MDPFGRTPQSSNSPLDGFASPSYTVDGNEYEQLIDSIENADFFIEQPGLDPALEELESFRADLPVDMACSLGNQNQNSPPNYSNVHNLSIDLNDSIDLNVSPFSKSVENNHGMIPTAATGRRSNKEYRNWHDHDNNKSLTETFESLPIELQNLIHDRTSVSFEQTAEGSDLVSESGQPRTASFVDESPFDENEELGSGHECEEEHGEDEKQDEGDDQSCSSNDISSLNLEEMNMSALVMNETDIVMDDKENQDSINQVDIITSLKKMENDIQQRAVSSEQDVEPDCLPVTLTAQSIERLAARPDAMLTESKANFKLVPSASASSLLALEANNNGHGYDFGKLVHPQPFAGILTRFTITAPLIPAIGESVKKSETVQENQEVDSHDSLCALSMEKTSEHQLEHKVMEAKDGNDQVPIEFTPVLKAYRIKNPLYPLFKLVQGSDESHKKQNARTISTTVGHEEIEILDYDEPQPSELNQMQLLSEEIAKPTSSYAETATFLTRLVLTICRQQQQLRAMEAEELCDKQRVALLETELIDALEELERLKQMEQEVLVTTSDSSFSREVMQDQVKGAFRKLYGILSDMDDEIEGNQPSVRQSSDDVTQDMNALLEKNVCRIKGRMETMLRSKARLHGEIDTSHHVAQDEKIKLMEERNSTLESQNEALRLQLDEVRDKMREFQSRSIVFNDSVEEMSSDGLDASRVELEAKVSALEDMLTSRDRQVVLLHKEVLAARSETSVSADKCSRLENDLFSALNKVQAVMDNNSNLKQQLVLQNVEASELRLKVEALASQKELCQFDLDKRAEKLEQDLSNHRAVIRELENSLHQRSEVIVKLEEETASYRLEASNAASDVEAMQFELETARTQAEQAEDERKALEVKVQRLQKENESLQKDLERSVFVQSQLREESAMLRKQVHDLENMTLDKLLSLESVAEQSAKLEVDLAELQERYDRLVSEHEVLRAKFDESSISQEQSEFIQRIEKILGAPRSSEGSANAMSDKLFLRVQELVEERSALYGKLENLSNEFQHQERAFKESRDLLQARLDGDMKDVQTQMILKDTQIDDLTSENKALQSRLAVALAERTVVKDESLNSSFASMDVSRSTSVFEDPELEHVLSVLDKVMRERRGILERNAELGRQMQSVLDSGETQAAGSKQALLLQESQIVHEELCRVIQRQDAVIHKLRHDLGNQADTSFASVGSEAFGVAILELHLSEMRNLWQSEVEKNQQLRRLFEERDEQSPPIKKVSVVERAAVTTGTFDREKAERLAYLDAMVERLEWREDMLQKELAEGSTWLEAICHLFGDKEINSSNVYLMRDAIESFVRKSVSMQARNNATIGNLQMQLVTVENQLVSVRHQKQVLCYLYGSKGYLAPHQLMNTEPNQKALSAKWKQAILAIIAMNRIAKQSTRSTTSTLSMVYRKVPNYSWKFSSETAVSALVAITALPRLESSLATKTRKIELMEAHIDELHSKILELESNLSGKALEKELKATKAEKANLADLFQKEARVSKELATQLEKMRKETDTIREQLLKEHDARKDLQKKNDKYVDKLREYSRLLQTSKRALSKRDEKYRSAVDHLMTKLDDYDKENAGVVAAAPTIASSSRVPLGASSKANDAIENAFKGRKEKAGEIIETMLLTARKDLEDAKESRVGTKVAQEMEQYIHGLENALTKLKH